MVDKNACILVDAELLTNQRTRNWVTNKSKHAAVVVLETQPGSLDKILTTSSITFMPAAILGNTKHLDDLVFKTAALCVIQDSSNLIPTVAIDDNVEILNMYEEGGVLVTLTSAQV